MRRSPIQHPLVAATLCLAMSLCPARPAGAVVLPMVEEIQLQSQWCWAAVGRSILRYYGHKVTQCAIAEYTRSTATWHDFGKVHCCTDPNQGCNYWNFYGNFDGSIQSIIKHFGSVTSVAPAKPLDLSAATAEIDTGRRPFVVRWGWNGGGGHFVLAHGLTDHKLHYMNPWFGEGKKIADFAWVAKGGNHTWTHTLRITTTCRCTANNACCDGCKPNNAGKVCDDKDACTAGDLCHSGGLCEGPKQVVCDNPGPCQSPGACDPGSGGCVYPSRVDGATCDDSDACTEGNTCLGGTCLAARFVVCDLPGMCEKPGTCNRADGACTYPPLADGTACDDGNPCTVGDSCSSGACSPGAFKTCPGDNPCLGPGICQASDGTCAYAALPDGTECPAGICTAGVCAPAPAADDGCAMAPADGWWLPLLLLAVVARRVRGSLAKTPRP